MIHFHGGTRLIFTSIFLACSGSVFAQYSVQVFGIPHASGVSLDHGNSLVTFSDPDVYRTHSALIYGSTVTEFNGPNPNGVTVSRIRGNKIRDSSIKLD